MTFEQNPTDAARRVDWGNVRDHILEHAEQQYAAAATSVTGSAFRGNAWIEDDYRLSVELIPDVAHWELLNPEGAEGVRLIERLTAVAADDGRPVEGPRKKSNGIWQWTWSDGGIRLRAVCVAVPEAYDAWCHGPDPDIHTLS